MLGIVIMLMAGFLPVSAPPDHPRIEVQGHRGARAMFPENTIPAFEYAIRAGADLLEMDLAVTRDNVLVVSHDPTLHPPICRGPRDQAVIRELTLAEVREWDCGATANPAFPKQTAVPGTRVPTLDQVLDLAATGRVGFNIEIKSDPKHPEYTPAPAEFARMVLDKIRRHGLEKRVVVQSFDFRTLVAMHAIAPDIRLAALTDSDQRDFAAIAKEADARIVSPHFRLVTRDKVAAAHAAGLKVIPWTANTPEQWAPLNDAGVDGIITDDPAALISYLREKGLR
jgi:glycerophosphoryl diester phosphodiesterase